MKFPLVHVKNGDPYHSDHRPMVVLTKMVPRSSGGSGGFKFEASWIQEEDCRKVIQEAWERRDSEGCFLEDSLRGVAASMKDWSTNVLGDLEKHLRKAKKKLEKWRWEPISDDLMRREAVWSIKWIDWRNR